MDYIALKAEITGDPLTRGYATMTDAQVAASLNAQTRSKARKIIPAYEIVAVLVQVEVAALNATDRQVLQIILSAGSVDIRGALIKALFPVGSATRAAIIALATEPASRAQELNLGETVTDRHVAKAKVIV